MLVSSIQLSDSAKLIYIFFSDFFHYKLLKDNLYNILNIIVTYSVTILGMVPYAIQ